MTTPRPENPKERMEVLRRIVASYISGIHHDDVIADEEIGVRPLDIMITTPAGKLFVLELPVFVIERIGENRVGEHVLFPNFTHDLHEHLLELNKVLNVVNGKLSVQVSTRTMPAAKSL